MNDDDDDIICVECLRFKSDCECGDNMGPMEPSANARQAAKELRGLFLALTYEGFTESQALTLIGQLLLANNSGENK